MEKPAYISPYLKVDFWVSFLEDLYGPPKPAGSCCPAAWTLPSPTLRKIDIEPVRNLYSYYSWGSFIIGFFQPEDRRRPIFAIFYGDHIFFRYVLDFSDIHVFVDFLRAIKDPSLLPLCINFKPGTEVISAALKDLC